MGGKLIIFESFPIFEDFLKSLGQFRLEMGLERMNKGLDILGISPEDIPVVQIVGTNGKGSTACFLEILARLSGFKTGLYTSPHLVSVKERIRVNNFQLPDDVWLDTANEVSGSCSGLDLTYFEFLTLMAALIFKMEKVNLAVMEAGLGGRYDATSAFHPAVNILTPVGLDHTHILGSTLEEIAMDKSLAMRKGPVVTANQSLGVMDVFKSRAEKIGADIYEVKDYFDFTGDCLRLRSVQEMFLKGSEMGLKGFYQLENAAAALLAWRIFAEKKGKTFDPDLCALALKNAFWPGRMHFVSQDPMVILDGAHNPQGMEALARALGEMGIKPETIVFSCLKDKNVGEMVEIVQSFKAGNIFIPDIKANPRAMPKEELVLLFGQRAYPLRSVKEYLAGLRNEDAPVLVCGSLYLLGDIYADFPRWLQR